MIDQIAVAPTRLGMTRLALIGAFVVFVVFVLCWGAGLLGIAATHSLVELFTPAPMASSAALLIGAIRALGFGAIVGALVAAGYNMTARFTRP